MKIFVRPKREEWAAILSRPAIDQRDLTTAVAAIMDDVERGGDDAVRRYTREFDQWPASDLEVSEIEFEEAVSRVPNELKSAIAQAKATIQKFHCSQADKPEYIETVPGVVCWRRSVAIERVGLYVPAGTAPLFSTVLMLAVPARVAGCDEIVICCPADREGKVDDAILYAARVCDATRVFKIGGAQAIAAMAFGTETVPKVYKIFGPGNQYVTCAKQLAFQRGAAIDMPAGPSEVAVFAGENCVPEFVAADILSQAEHGSDSHCILVSTKEQVVQSALLEVEKQLETLPRRTVAKAALENSAAIVVDDTNEAIELLNSYAPEHLILAAADAEGLARRVVNAGSVFLGNFSCESSGDYASGTNHTLPTGGAARAFSGVSLDSFVKKITFQKVTEEGIRNLGPAIATMAAAEGLDAHRRAIEIRMEAIDGV